MNAGCANVVVCAWPGPCCQPGVVYVVCGRGDNASALEFCERHAWRARRRWGA